MSRIACLVAVGCSTLVLGTSLAGQSAAPADAESVGVVGDSSRAPAIASIVQLAYLKASNTESLDEFGRAVAVSGDTLVVGAARESSSATGVDGDQDDDGAFESGAAYVFVRSGESWVQQAYLKASNTEAEDAFGRSVAVSGDTIVVGAPAEDSRDGGVNGDQADNGAPGSGAAYVFVRSGGTWSQQAYLKAVHPDQDDSFGWSVGASGDTIVVGASREASNATGVNGDQADDSAPDSGAAYVFVRNGGSWSQQAYLKAPVSAQPDLFGSSVAVSGDIVVIGAPAEDSQATGVNGDPTDNNASESGAAYVFARTGATWHQQAYLKASNTAALDTFGTVAVSGDTIVVGAHGEDSGASGVNGNQLSDGADLAGAAYVFVRSGGNTWIQQAYVKASNTGEADQFGQSVAVSGNTLVIGAFLEDSSAAGIDGDQSSSGSPQSGAAYVLVRDGATWSHQAYLKASNPAGNDNFGVAVGVSADAVVVGAHREDSGATGVDGDQGSDDAPSAGATYAFDLDLLPEPWADLGLGLAGVSGVPVLAGTGTLVGGDPVALLLTNAKPSSSAALIVGLSLLAAPFKGGTLVPSPDVVIPGWPTDAGGVLVIHASWPVGIPSGFAFWFQEWVSDAAGPAGFAASNGLAALTP